MDLARAGGLTIAYRRAGSGEPLLLLHGGWSDGREWARQLDDLSDEFDVVAWDAPGCGGSPDPPADLTMAGYADAVADLAGALGLGPVHLCGLSFGGGLALAVYRRHPDLVRSLVLASAYAGWKGSLPPEEVEARVSRVRAELDRPPAEWVDAYLPGFFAGPVPQETLDLVRTVMLDVRPAGTRSMLTAFADADLRDVLPTVAVPTLLLYGAEDVRAPRSVAEALHAAIPGSRLVFLPGVGHVTNLEAPEAFDAELRRFL
ncbi:alpha/beta fold hydrolase [Geodermatophilus marinus]|uniref:alpha/beta fold hydrolase n=1 Tax=Geodermatophilus sp. LHW52908 TaxID=2303986 RepID=UPI000E3E6BAD|nr:alpha/beta fold hydrolase [Geodermatophilus sp. LHW52908]RFU20460.1 alpha/beta fold hydrolase [Geodermatophilus sp. LHW52908]